MGYEPLLEPGHRADAVLAIAVHRHETPETVRIGLIGEIDMVAVAAIQETVHTVLTEDHPRRLVLDLGQVTFLDSSGIRALLQCHVDAELAHCRLTLADPRPQVRLVLEITELLDYFGLA